MPKRPTQPAAPASPTPPTEPLRFATPFFKASPPSPVSDAQAEWHRQNLGPVPAVIGDGSFDLATIIGAPAIQEIAKLGEIRFHSLGDSGFGTGEEAERVADRMTPDFQPDAGALNPAFLLHLGDVVYGADKSHNYADRFYRAYRNYPGKIVAIPGNHDGEIKSTLDRPSLSAFRENFCAAHAAVPEVASALGIFRQTMTQPGVYWLLDAPFVRVIGLYSNLLENPGYIEGKTEAGVFDTGQRDWLETTLRAIAAMPDRKALIIATHHPPYSQSGHAGSTAMSAEIDAACEAAGLYPDLFLSGHAHNYQRYTRRIAGKTIPYIVAGTGGMNPQHVADATGQPADGSATVTYDRALASLGYLFITVSGRQLRTEFWPLATSQGAAFDTVTVDIGLHTIT